MRTLNKTRSFKGRRINYDKPARVYRNLNQKGVVWSIVQDGLVVAHADRLCMCDVEFRVSEAGMKRAQRLGHRVVCGWAVGKISKRGCMGTDGSQSLPFTVKFDRETGFNLKGADGVVFNNEGCSAAYTYR